MGAVWPNVFVTENSLVQCISDIRAALGPEGATILKTVARRGYMFAAPLSAETPPQSGRVAEPPVPQAPPHGDRRARAAARRHGRRLGGGGRRGDRGRPAAQAPVDRCAAAGRVESGDDYLATGLGEDIIAALARFPDLAVLAPRTVAAYRGRTPAREEIARDLKVRYLADGSVRRSGGRLRISMRLADADGTLIWADQYEGDADQMIAFQDEICVTSPARWRCA